jgi:hypothetical protein
VTEYKQVVSAAEDLGLIRSQKITVGRVRRDQPEQRFPVLGERAWAEAREGGEGATVAHIGGPEGREGREGRVSEYDVWRHAAASHRWH